MKGEMSMEMVIWIILGLIALGLIIYVFFIHFNIGGKIAGAVDPLSNLGK